MVQLSSISSPIKRNTMWRQYNLLLNNPMGSSILMAMLTTKLKHLFISHNSILFRPRTRLPVTSINIKLRFHLSVMRMQMMNANATKNQKHWINIEELPFLQMRMWNMMMTEWIPSWVIGPNVNGLADWKSLHTQGYHRVADASHRG